MWSACQNLPKADSTVPSSSLYATVSSARTPYPMTVPRYHTVASEVATIEYLRSHGLPAPKIYGYSPDSNNTAGSLELLIMMELVHGSRLTEVWPSLDHQEVISVVRHYHYVTSTEECKQLHHTAFTDPLYALRGCLFQQAVAPWEGEIVELMNVLIQATEKWEELTGGGVPCPVKFDTEDLRETTALNEELSEAVRNFELLQRMWRIGEEGWVRTEDYENAVASLKTMKEDWLANSESVEEREEIMAHWPWDDMDEMEYM